MHVRYMISLVNIAEIKGFLFSPKGGKNNIANCLTTYKIFSLTLKPISSKSDTGHRRSEVERNILNVHLAYHHIFFHLNPSS